MNNARFVIGTGTDVGKTMVSALLALKFNAHYFKPIQAGVPTDSDFMRNVIGHARVHDEIYRLEKPLSPNQAARYENIRVDISRISLSDKSENSRLIVESAGGLLSPINECETMIDLAQHLNLKTIVVARSGLGTISHTLQTIAVLRENNICVSSIILFGDPHPLNKNDIALRTKLRVIDMHEIKLCAWENI